MKDSYYIELKIFASDPDKMKDLVGQFEHIHYGIEHESEYNGIRCTEMRKNAGMLMLDIRTTNDLELELMCAKEEIDDLRCRLDELRK